jgi:hypothetical protein
MFPANFRGLQDYCAKHEFQKARTRQLKSSCSNTATVFARAFRAHTMFYPLTCVKEVSSNQRLEQINQDAAEAAAHFNAARRMKRDENEADEHEEARNRDGQGLEAYVEHSINGGTTRLINGTPEEARAKFLAIVSKYEKDGVSLNQLETPPESLNSCLSRRR